MKRVLAVLAALLLGGAALLLPELLLSRQEQRLYAEKEMVSGAGIHYESGNTTLARRLYVLANCSSSTAVDFSVGAQLYYDAQTLGDMFLEELSVLSEACANFGAPYLQLLARRDTKQEGLTGPALQEEVAWRENVYLGYSCIMDKTTGDTFFVATLRDVNDSYLRLCMDMTSGKLIITESWASPPEENDGDIQETAQLVKHFADYLGLSCVNYYRDLYLLRDRQTEDSVLYVANSAWERIVLLTVSAEYYDAIAAQVEDHNG